MSVDMYVSSSQSQASSVAAICRQQRQGYEQLQRAINDFVVGSPQLQGAAYDSAKQFFNAVLMPLSKGGILLSEAVMEACQKFPEEYMASVDSGDLRESDLREKIDQLNRQMSELSELHNRLQTMLYRQQQDGALDGSIASRMSGAHSLMATYGRAKQKLQEKLDKLLAFDGRSPDIFSEIDELKQFVKTGTGVANVSWNSSLGTFTMPKSDKMGWAKDVNELWQERQDKERQAKLNAFVFELKKCDSISYTSGKNASWMILKDGKIVYDEEIQKLLNQYGYETISGLVDVNIVHIIGGEGIYLFPGGWGNGALTGITKWIPAILAGTGIVIIGGQTTLNDAYIDKLRTPTGLDQIKGGINKIGDDLSDLTNNINIWLSQNKITRSSHAKIRSAEGRNVNTAINDLQRARPADILLQDDGRWLVTGGNGRVHVIDPSGEIVTTMNNVSKSNLQKRINSNRWSRLTLEEKQQFENSFKDYLNWD